MKKKSLKTYWCTYTLVCLGVLVAMQLILSRMLAINVGGFARVTLGSVATIMSGVWFGPAAGALTGFTADILGCLIQGYSVNPFITVSAMLWGVITSLFVYAGSGSSKKRQILWTCLGVVSSCVICTLFLTTTGLVVMYGYSLAAILPTRLIQFACMCPIYCVLVNLLYFSPVTTQLQSHLSFHAARRPGRHLSRQ